MKKWDRQSSVPSPQPFWRSQDANLPRNTSRYYPGVRHNLYKPWRSLPAILLQPLNRVIFLLLKSRFSIIWAAAQKINDEAWKENMRKWESRGSIRAGTAWNVHSEGEEGQEPNFSEDAWWRKDHARWWPSRSAGPCSPLFLHRYWMPHTFYANRGKSVSQSDFLILPTWHIPKPRIHTEINSSKISESKISLMRETNLFTAKSPVVLGENNTDDRQAHRHRYAPRCLSAALCETIT